jgi:hypothetical protein
MLHAVREISKVTQNKLDLRHIHVKSAERTMGSEKKKLWQDCWETDGKKE